MKLTQICKCNITEINDCICVYYVKCASYVLHGYCRGILFCVLEQDENKKTLTVQGTTTIKLNH